MAKRKGRPPRRTVMRSPYSGRDYESRRIRGIKCVTTDQVELMMESIQELDWSDFDEIEPGWFGPSSNPASVEKLLRLREVAGKKLAEIDREVDDKTALIQERQEEVMRIQEEIKVSWFACKLQTSNHQWISDPDLRTSQIHVRDDDECPFDQEET